MINSIGNIKAFRLRNRKAFCCSQTTAGKLPFWGDIRKPE